MHTFIVADSSADPWSAFHRDAAAKDARKPPFVEKTARLALSFGEASAMALQRLADQISDEEAEELVRRYRANYGRK